MPERLSADDARILGLESDAIAGHTLKLVVLAPGDGPLDVDALRAQVDARLPAGSRGRQRVEVDGDGVAAWADDDGFDVSAHVQRHPPGACDDDAALWREASGLMSQRLDHARPLWRFDVVGPLADGREAIVCRIHHAMADGISSVRFLREVLWDEGEQPAPKHHAQAPAAAAGHSRLREFARMPGAIGRELGHRAAATVLDRRIGSGRELAFSSFPLAELKAIGASRPGHVTVNDVFLTGVAGGLRSWLQHAGERLPKLRAQIPVSLHHRDEGEAQLGNRDSFLNVDLPIDEPDPIARLEAINAQTVARKAHGDAEELYDLFHALSRFKRLDHAAQHLAGGPREFSLAISNVPGPSASLSVCGRNVESLFSVAEPADRHALRASAISCSGTIGIGLCTDPDAVAGIDRLAAAIDASLAELREATTGWDG